MSSSPKFTPKSTVVVDLASMVPDLYATDVEKYKEATLLAVVDIEKRMSDATGSAAKTAAVVGGISSLGVTAVCGGKLPKEVFELIQKYVIGILNATAVASVAIVALHGYNYSRQKKNMEMLVGESGRLADVIVDADDATLYRVNREAGNTSEISRLPNNTLIFMLPSLLKLVVIFGITFALVVLAGEIGEKIAKH